MTSSSIYLIRHITLYPCMLMEFISHSTSSFCLFTYNKYIDYRYIKLFMANANVYDNNIRRHNILFIALGTLCGTRYLDLANKCIGCCCCWYSSVKLSPSRKQLSHEYLIDREFSHEYGVVAQLLKCIQSIEFMPIPACACS